MVGQTTIAALDFVGLILLLGVVLWYLFHRRPGSGYLLPYHVVTIAIATMFMSAAIERGIRITSDPLFLRLAAAGLIFRLVAFVTMAIHLYQRHRRPK